MITIDWPSKVISIPRADLTLIQETPTEIRELNLDWFRLTLKALESDEGIIYIDTHQHNPPVTIGGVTLAMVVEIINGYTITFEDGQYAVNLVGANSNVGDRVNVNQVSIRSANSAGMTSSAAIEYSSYNGGVTVDLLSSISGTVFPVGTPQLPVNNFNDALLIAGVRGFSTFFILGDAEVSGTNDYEGMNFVGESQTKTTLNIHTDAMVSGCEFYDAFVEGTLDGNAKLKDCIIADLAYINGLVERCLLESGVITLGGDNEAIFIDCWSGAVSQNLAPAIDMGGVGQDLILRNYNGAVRIRNLSGQNSVSIDLNSGKVTLESTVAAGTITVRGVGTVEDLSTGTAEVITDDLINPEVITRKVWDEPTTGHQTAGSFGGDLKAGFDVIARALGLTQENYYLDQAQYDGGGHMTSCRMRTYTDAISVGTDLNVLATYVVTSTWNGAELETYKVVKQ